MISLENIIRMVKEVLNEDKGTRLSDSMNIYNKEGIASSLDVMREHINYIFDNINDDEVPLAVTLSFTVGLAKIQPEAEED